MHVTNIKDSRTSRFIGYLVLSCWSAIFIAGYISIRRRSCLLPSPIACTFQSRDDRLCWSLISGDYGSHSPVISLVPKGKKNQVASKCQRMPNLESSATGWDCKVDLQSAEDFVVGLDCTWSNLQTEKQLTDDVSNDASALYTYTRK
jgi:hypothetical protein